MSYRGGRGAGGQYRIASGAGEPRQYRRSAAAGARTDGKAVVGKRGACVLHAHLGGLAHLGLHDECVLHKVNGQRRNDGVEVVQVLVRIGAKLQRPKMDKRHDQTASARESVCM